MEIYPTNAMPFNKGSATQGEPRRVAEQYHFISRLIRLCRLHLLLHAIQQPGLNNSWLPACLPPFSPTQLARWEVTFCSPWVVWIIISFVPLIAFRSPSPSSPPKAAVCLHVANNRNRLAANLLSHLGCGDPYCVCKWVGVSVLKFWCMTLLLNGRPDWLVPLIVDMTNQCTGFQSSPSLHACSSLISLGPCPRSWVLSTALKHPCTELEISQAGALPYFWRLPDSQQIFNFAVWKRWTHFQLL